MPTLCPLLGSACLAIDSRAIRARFLDLLLVPMLAEYAWYEPSNFLLILPVLRILPR